MPWFIHVSVLSLVQGESHVIFSGRSSDFRIILLTAPSQPLASDNLAAFVLEYSGGPVPESHGVPYYSLRNLKME